ncbi:MAG: hypothetical protein ABIK92_13550 [Pseudomonadota bacterium]
MPLIVNLYFESFDVFKLVDIAEQIESDCNRKFTDNYLRYFIPLKFDDEYHYTNIHDFEVKLKNRGVKDLFSIFFTVEGSGKIQGTEITLMLKPKIKKNIPFVQLYFQIDENIVKHSHIEILNNLIENCSSLGNIRYGLLDQMPYSKLPLLYYFETFNDDLSKKEENRIYTWKMHKDKYDTKIWDVFLGNVFTEKHISGDPSIINEIKSIVGPDNFIAKNKLFLFVLPINKHTTDLTVKLEMLFKNKNLLMTQQTEADYYDSLT